jgi:hypothetical protein
MSGQKDRGRGRWSSMRAKGRNRVGAVILRCSNICKYGYMDILLDGVERRDVDMIHAQSGGGGGGVRTGNYDEKELAGKEELWQRRSAGKARRKEATGRKGW